MKQVSDSFNLFILNVFSSLIFEVTLDWKWSEDQAFLWAEWKYGMIAHDASNQAFQTNGGCGVNVIGFVSFHFNTKHGVAATMKQNH